MRTDVQPMRIGISQWVRVYDMRLAALQISHGYNFVKLRGFGEIYAYPDRV